MTYSPLSIEIIKLLGSKELSDGCIYRTNDSHRKFYKVITLWGDGNIADVLQIGGTNSTGRVHGQILDKIEIIGHLPTLEDLFIKAEEKGFGHCNIDNYSKYLFLINGKITKEITYNPKLKPYQQTEETMQQILNLFK